VERLLSDGHEMIVLDNLSNGTLSNLEQVTNNQHLTVPEVDRANPSDAAPLLAGVDWVYHLAALADIVPTIQNPLKYHRANVDGTVSFLEAVTPAGNIPDPMNDVRYYNIKVMQALSLKSKTRCTAMLPW
jgi:UDP-glucose 4-epimerase